MQICALCRLQISGMVKLNMNGPPLAKAQANKVVQVQFRHWTPSAEKAELNSTSNISSESNFFAEIMKQDARRGPSRLARHSDMKYRRWESVLG
jgi:hypothetical protein